MVMFERQIIPLENYSTISVLLMYCDLPSTCNVNNCYTVTSRDRMVERDFNIDIDGMVVLKSICTKLADSTTNRIDLY